MTGSSTQGIKTMASIESVTLDVVDGACRWPWLGCDTRRFVRC